VPHIIRNQSPGGGNIWEAFCGKTVWFHDKPFRDAKHAEESGDAICRTCRKAAGIPPKKKVPVFSSIEFRLDRMQLALTYESSDNVILGLSFREWVGYYLDDNSESRSLDKVSMSNIKSCLEKINKKYKEDQEKTKINRDDVKLVATAMVHLEWMARKLTEGGDPPSDIEDIIATVNGLRDLGVKIDKVL